MASRPLRILQIGTADVPGGAEKVACGLFNAYRAKGHRSWLAVGFKRGASPDVFQLRDHTVDGYWARLWLSLGEAISPLVGKVRGAWWLRHQLHLLSCPRRFLDWWQGAEDFNFPESWRVLEIPPERPDVVHCHNLHGGYFDLRALSWLSQQVPLVLTLHDAWMLSGHCAHSFDCERWKIGCGHCPDLNIYPAIKRDATAYNWRRKREIYAKSRLYVATPSRWLMQKVEQSILAPAIADARVIPNGVDLSIFRPADRREVRRSLGISSDARVLLFTANHVRRNVWKDYETLRTAVALLSERLREKVLFIAMGDRGPEEQVGRAEIRLIPYTDDPLKVAAYYQAADLYIHAAKADTFPLTILEALACGTPVVATAVGGIAEQVNGLGDTNGLSFGWKVYGPEHATGILVPPGQAEAMAFGIEYLLRDESRLRQIGKNATETAQRRFDLQRQVDQYLEWYSEILKGLAASRRHRDERTGVR